MLQSFSDRIRDSCFGGLAQLGERLHGMQEVSGSIPLSSTKTKSLSSRGLGHDPFTVGTGVRIPVGTPNKENPSGQRLAGFWHLRTPERGAFRDIPDRAGGPDALGRGVGASSVMTALVGFFLDGTAHDVEDFVDRGHHVHVRAGRRPLHGRSPSG